MRPVHSAISAIIFAGFLAGSAVADQRNAAPTTRAAVDPLVCAKTFREADINGDGVLTREDTAKLNPSNDFIGKADTNNDGIVTVAEFNAGCSKNLLHKAEKKQR